MMVPWAKMVGGVELSGWGKAAGLRDPASGRRGPAFCDAFGGVSILSVGRDMLEVGSGNAFCFSLIRPGLASAPSPGGVARSVDAVPDDAPSPKPGRLVCPYIC